MNLPVAGAQWHQQWSDPNFPPPSFSIIGASPALQKRWDDPQA